jgi:hypothetical protein
MIPIGESIYAYSGITITNVMESNSTYPAEKAGIEVGEVIYSINDEKIETVEDFITMMDTKTPGESLSLSTNKTSYSLTLEESPDDPEQGYLGISVRQHITVREKYKENMFIPNVFSWIWELLGWLYILNIGIGLFNFVPLGPVDGGRILLTSLQKIFSKETSMKIWKYISLLFLLLILTNIIFSFVRR